MSALENKSSSTKSITQTREQKANKVVNSLGVKLHHFDPSGRELWTVVGTEGDSLVNYDPSGQGPQYCSCDDFHFRVLGKTVPECYHLIAAKIARKENIYSKIDFSDDEYATFLRLLLGDIFSRIS